MILIVGASGRLGRVVAERLLAQGKSVRAMTRTPGSVEHLRQHGAEVVLGDLRDPVSLAHACQGVEQVVAAAHALVGKGDNNPQSVDAAGHRNLIDAAKAAGVQHFILLSVLEAGPEAALEFFRIKYHTEEYLRASGLSFTILRCGAFMDLWGEVIGLPLLQQGKTTLFGRGTNPINFVAVDDVARFVLTALDDPRAHQQVIGVGGPENLTFNQVADLFERKRGRPAKKRHVPLPLMRVLAHVMLHINPALGRQISAGVYMDTANLRYDMTETLKTFPLPLTRWEQWIERHAVSNLTPQREASAHDPKASVP